MDPGAIPYLVDDLAVRLSEQGCQVRRLERIDDVVELGGSAAAFLERCNGRRTVAEVVDEVVALSGVARATIAADGDELLEGLRRRGLVAAGAAPVAGADRPYLGVVAPFVRSTIHVDITHRCDGPGGPRRHDQGARIARAHAARAGQNLRARPARPRSGRT